MTDLDHIWDDDAVTADRRPATSEPLFLPDEADIDKVFEDGLADVEDSIPVEDTGDFVLEPLQRLDASSLRKAADEERRREEALLSSQYEVLPSSSPAKDQAGPVTKKEREQKKDRRKVLRLDEGRLINDDGFPQLIKDVKYFKVKGKGHEATDLRRLLQVYQFWTHRLYPKTQFKDTVERVEKLCHSRLMQSKLSTWRDEFHGKGNKTVENDDVIDLTENEQESSVPPTRPPTSPSEGAEDEVSTRARKTTNRRVIDDEDDDEMWGAFDHDINHSSTPPPAANGDEDEIWAMIDDIPTQGEAVSSSSSVIQIEDDDEEMRAIMAEMEEEAQVKAHENLKQSAMQGVSEPPRHEPQGTRSFVEEDADDMYI